MCPFEHFQGGSERYAWVLSQEGEKWSVKFEVRDLGGHLDTTFRGWSATLAARVRLVISRLVLIFVLPLDFSWSGSCGQVCEFACCSSWS